MAIRMLTKSIRLLALISIVLLVSCAKDEHESSLVGSWEGISFITSAPVDENMDGVSHTNLYEEMECVALEASFTARGNFTLSSFDATYNIEIVDGEAVLTPTGCAPVDENGNWNLNDASTTLYLEFEVPGKDESTLIQVGIELSDQVLVMKNLPFSDDGTITYTVEYRRI